jgi:hypothetical protein
MGSEEQVAARSPRASSARLKDGNFDPIGFTGFNERVNSMKD